MIFFNNDDASKSTFKREIAEILKFLYYGYNNL